MSFCNNLDESVGEKNPIIYRLLSFWKPPPPKFWFLGCQGVLFEKLDFYRICKVVCEFLAY